MFDVKVYKTIWNKCEEEVEDILNNDTDRLKDLNETTYFYDVTLEFAPFYGLEIHSAQWRSGSITRILWSIDKKCFYCYTDDEYPQHSTNDPTLDFDEIFLKERCLRNGWKLLEEPCGPDQI